MVADSLSSAMLRNTKPHVFLGCPANVAPRLCQVMLSLLFSLLPKQKPKQKHYENIGFPLEPMENNMKTHVFHGNLLKTIRKLRFSVETYGKALRQLRFSMGTYGNHWETTGFPWEPMENIMKTLVFHGTCGKHMENIGCQLKPMENIRKHTCFPWEPMENIKNTSVFRWNPWKTIGKHSFFRGNIWKT